ncbi:hypothetical protein NVP2275O_263 [Vibrio phage 2.275.O._10N.286.54.E11]|nr:hypothetical protein NVP2275O_263 [Vibrio phage 2.275.O._10N.286.54.E11]
MRMLTNEQLNDPDFFNNDEYNAEKEASYQRALDFYNSLRANAKIQRMKNARKGN